MALFNITIERVIVRQDDELLKEINCKLDKLLKGNNSGVKELEAQMDGWLLTLKESIGKIETVSDKVDSKK